MKNYTLSTDDSIMLMIDIQERLVPAMYPGNKAVEANGIMLQALRKWVCRSFILNNIPRVLAGLCLRFWSTFRKKSLLEGCLFSL